MKGRVIGMGPPQGQEGTGKLWFLLALPREMWQEIDRGCGCKYCLGDRYPGPPVRAWWDTLSFTIDMQEPEDVDAVLCHAPEWQP